MIADWVVTLPPSKDGFDKMLTITDHFTKRVILGTGKSTWSAQEWGRKWIDLLI
jgi:hypothetical protein